MYKVQIAVQIASRSGVNEFFFSSAPGQPKNVRVKVLSPRSIQVTWKAPTFIGNGIYVYEVYCNKSRSTVNTYTVANDVFAYEIRGLHPHTNYRIQVAARSSDVGPLSFAKVVKTLEDGKKILFYSLRVNS